MNVRRSGWFRAARDLLGAMLPLSLRRLEREIDERLTRIPTETNDYGYDPHGMHVGTVRRAMLPAALLYRYYFRAQSFGLQSVPAGRALLVANHAGQLPFDAAMLSAAMLLEAEPPRVARGMGEYWIPKLPWISVVAARTGALVGTPENCVAMLEAEECVMVFPEGVRGINKVFADRYELKRFGVGFMRLALETKSPIVPVGIVGSEEQQPGIANLEGLGKTLGMPAFPITLGFPWLGPLGLLPLPVKYRIYVGEPLRFEGSPLEEDADIQRKVDVVRSAIGGLLERGCRERSGVFT